jgi:hypothetical protein
MIKFMKNWANVSWKALSYLILNKLKYNEGFLVYDKK